MQMVGIQRSGNEDLVRVLALLVVGFMDGVFVSWL